MRNLALVAGLVLGSSSAFAEDRPITFGATAFGIVGGNFLTQPSDSAVSANGSTVDAPYPGFGGVGGGFGFGLDARYREFLGLEIDLILSSDRGKATLENPPVVASTEVTIGQQAWHLPILARVALPLPIVEPFILAGPEFVFPGESEASPANFGTGKLTAHADTYTMITLGVGAEFKLPIPELDVRMPLTLRGSVNPGLGSDIGDRATYQFGKAAAPDGQIYSKAIESIDFNSQWKYQAAATLGVSMRL